MLLGGLWGLYSAPLLAEDMNVKKEEQTEASVLPQSIKRDGKFQNLHAVKTRNLAQVPAIAKEWVLNKHRLSEPAYGLIPVSNIAPEQLEHGNSPRFYRLGHSTLLISLDQQWWLIDPVFSERASPVQWAGPKRFHPVPLAIQDLPELTGVIISHDHYDHLDKASVQQLKQRAEHFVVPLGVDQYLRQWGVAPHKIHGLGWWQSFVLGSVEVTAAPAQHFSGRGLGDGDSTLWASWGLRGDSANLFYSGDGGYFDGFKLIGQQLGPFDITFIETGAYNKTWELVHMTPEQSVQAHLDVQGRYMVPVHNSTFDLALHAWYEPLERVIRAAQQQGVHVLTPSIGAGLSLKQISQSDFKTAYWWQTLMPTDDADRLSQQP